MLSVVRLCKHVTCVIICTLRSGWLGFMAALDWWRWRSWARSDQWCWFNFFGSQVVGKFGFSRSGSARSIVGLKRG